MYGSSQPTLDFQLYRQHVPQVTRVKYLGIYLTLRLSWEAQVDAISAKVRPRVGALTRVFLCQFFPKNLCVLLYKALIESVILYAAPAWYCQSPSVKKQLLDMQANALRSIFNLPFEVDVADILAFAGIDSIEERFDQALVRFGERSLANKGTTAKYIRYIARTKPSPGFAYDTLNKHCPAWHLRTCKRPVDVPLNDNRQWLTFH